MSYTRAERVIAYYDGKLGEWMTKSLLRWCRADSHSRMKKDTHYITLSTKDLPVIAITD